MFEINLIKSGFINTNPAFIPTMAAVRETAIAALTSEVALWTLAVAGLALLGVKMAQAYSQWALSHSETNNILNN